MDSITSAVNVIPQFVAPIFAVMLRCMFLLPEEDNDGRRLDAEITETESDLATAFGGFTELGTARGAWLGAGGKLYRDRTRVYFTLIPETDLLRLQAILQGFKRKTLQEAIYLEVQRDVQTCFV